jgi:hypothetical protein
VEKESHEKGEVNSFKGTHCRRHVGSVEQARSRSVGKQVDTVRIRFSMSTRPAWSVSIGQFPFVRISVGSLLTVALGVCNSFRLGAPSVQNSSSFQHSN